MTVTYATGTWALAYTVSSGATYYAQTGKVNFRLWKSTNANGSGATQLTAGWTASAAISFTAALQAKTGTITTASISRFSLAGEYLWIEVAWDCIVSGGNAGATVTFSTNGGTAESLAVPTSTPTYWDFGTGLDTGVNNGSASYPFQNLATASTQGGAGTPTVPVEIRSIGRAMTAMTAGVGGTWTANSTTVGFATDPGLIVGDYIMPSTRTDAMSFRVTAINQGAGYDVTVAYAWRGTTSSSPETTMKVACIGLTAGQTLSAAGQTLTFGWNPASGLQDAGYISAFKRTSGTFILFNPAQANTIIACGAGLLRLFPYGSGSAGLLFINQPKSLTGTVEVSDASTGVVLVNTSSNPYDLYAIDTILSNGAPTGVLGILAGKMTIDRIVAWNTGASYGLCPGIAYGMFLRIVSASVVGGPASVAATTPCGIQIGTLSADTNSTFSSSPGTLQIGNLVFSAGSPTFFGNVSVGGPVSLWRVGTTYGVADKTTGRSGGSDYCLRFTPNSAILPLEWPIATIAASGKSVTLGFWCYYTSASSTAPTCTVSLIEPNGLTATQVQAFAPPITTWGYRTVTFTGTTLQQGSLQAVIQVTQNPAVDAVLYMDDMAFTGAGNVAYTGNIGYHGLMPLLQNVPVYYRGR